MSGWLYLIKNGDLYKIGITKNINKRMRQLKPDYVVAKIYSSRFRELEKEFHKIYKNVRIPQTEYFRLNQKQIKNIKERISKLSYPKSISFFVFIKSTTLVLILFILVSLLMSLTINDINNVLFNSLLWMEKITFCISFLSFFFKSDKYLSLLNEIKYRSSRSLFFVFYAILFRFVSDIIS